MDAIIEKNKLMILQLAEINGVTNLRVFGSMARDEARADSDVDFLVDLAPGNSGLALGGFLMDVSELLHRKVDVVTVNALHPEISRQVLMEAQAL
jgi:predicted nucleotidyltransferase